jgi:hypothetical protein
MTFSILSAVIDEEPQAFYCARLKVLVSEPGIGEGPGM